MHLVKKNLKVDKLTGISFVLQSQQRILLRNARHFT